MSSSQFLPCWCCRRKSSSVLLLMLLLVWRKVGAAASTLVSAEESRNSHINTLTSLQSERKLDSTISRCGNLECLNYGKCIHGHNMNEQQWSTSNDKHLCDCSTAWELIGVAPSMKMQRFVGRNCQIAVEIDDYCTSDRDLFCVNGGTCRDKAQNFSEQPCGCLDGFTGRHCEYAKHEVAEDCLLNCNGVGKCYHGVNPFSDQGAGGILDTLSSSSSTTGETPQYMYCDCADGYAGTNCEYTFTKCGGYNRYCFHGSTCVDGPNGGKQCECDLSASIKAAGEVCEFRATDNCQHPGFATQNHDVANRLYTADTPFCVNNGVCVQEKIGRDDFYYCECDQAHWKGKRCEIKVQQPSPAPPTTEASITEYPTPPTDKPSDWPTTWESPSPSPALKPNLGGWGDNYKDNDPNRQKAASLNKGSVASNLNDNGNNNKLSGSTKFGLLILSFAVSFTLAIVAWRFYQRRVIVAKAKDVLSAVHDPNAGNLQLDIISEENDVDGMDTIDINDSSSSSSSSTPFPSGFKQYRDHHVDDMGDLRQNPSIV